MEQLVAADLDGDLEGEMGLPQPFMEKERTQWKGWKGTGEAFYIHGTQHLRGKL